VAAEPVLALAELFLRFGDGPSACIGHRALFLRGPCFFVMKLATRSLTNSSKSWKTVDELPKAK
jgi:hypothetical protein